MMQRNNGFLWPLQATGPDPFFAARFDRKTGINAHLDPAVSPKGLFALTLGSMKIQTCQALVPHGLQGSKMKLTAIKAAVAICMLVPVMAMAKETKPVATTFSYTFSDVADTNVKIGKNNAQGFLLVQASWTDLLSGFKSMVQSQASSLTWSLTSSNGKQTFQQGVLADVAGDLNKGVIVLNESSLSKGEYKLTLSGIWSGSATGIKDNWEHQDVKVNLGAKTFSAVSPVPEPESYAMLLAGLGLMGTIALRRKKSDAS